MTLSKKFNKIKKYKLNKDNSTLAHSMPLLLGTVSFHSKTSH